MNNPKTTVAGYLVLFGTVAMTVAHAMGAGLGPADITNLLAALAGIGLVMAKDGGH